MIGKLGRKARDILTSGILLGTLLATSLTQLACDTKTKALDRALARIETEIDPQNYGFGEILTREHRGNSMDQQVPFTYVDHPRGDATNSKYDCVDAAVTACRFIEEEGIGCSVAEAIDQMGIFQKHYFALTETGVRVDALPIYPLLGAEHKILRIVPKAEINETAGSRKIPTQSLAALSFSQEGETQYLSLLGLMSEVVSPMETSLREINGIKMPDVRILYQAYEIKNGTPTNMYYKDILVLGDPYLNLLRLGFREGGQRVEDLSLGDLIDRGAAVVSEGGFGLINPEPGILRLETGRSEIGELALRAILEEESVTGYVHQAAIVSLVGGAPSMDW